MNSSICNNTTIKENIDNRNNQIPNETSEQFPNGKYKKKSEYSNFLLKLYQIIENDEYKNIINWSEDGKFFIIFNPNDFSQIILPTYFKHNNYSSFIRQLNMYNFHKKRSRQNMHIFYNENFIKNRKDLIKEIKRKKVGIMSNSNSKHKLFESNKINVNNNINNCTNNRQSSLSLSNDKDLNLINFVNSSSESENKASLPVIKPFSNNNNNLNIYNDYYLNNDNYLKKDNFDSNDNIDVNNNINMNVLNESNDKITKKNIENLLMDLTRNIQINSEKEKQLQIKIERVSRQNEEFMIQNQNILKEITKKNDYNKKLQTIICFIFEMMIKTQKSKNEEMKNYLCSGRNDLYQFDITDYLASKYQINDIILKTDNSSDKVESLESFENFMNLYMEESNKSRLIINNQKSNNIVGNKRKRSENINSNESDLSKEINILYDNSYNNNKFEPKDYNLQIEEKKLDDILIENNYINNESLNNLNQIENIFDIIK